MKHLSRLLFFLLLVAPAAFAQGYIHGNGDPRVTGVDCGRSRFYIDDTTSIMYLAGPGSPCVWTVAGSTPSGSLATPGADLLNNSTQTDAWGTLSGQWGISAFGDSNCIGVGMPGASYGWGAQLGTISNSSASTLACQGGDNIADFAAKAMIYGGPGDTQNPATFIAIGTNNVVAGHTGSTYDQAVTAELSAGIAKLATSSTDQYYVTDTAFWTRVGTWVVQQPWINSLLAFPGSNICAGDVFALSGGDGLEQITVYTVSGGHQSTYGITQWGSGYSVGQNIASTLVTSPLSCVGQVETFNQLAVGSTSVLTTSGAGTLTSSALYVGPSGTVDLTYPVGRLFGGTFKIEAAPVATGVYVLLTDSITGSSTLNEAFGGSEDQSVNVPTPIGFTQSPELTAKLARFTGFLSGQYTFRLTRLTGTIGVSHLTLPPTLRIRGLNEPHAVVAGVIPEFQNANASTVAYYNSLERTITFANAALGYHAKFVDVGNCLDPYRDFLEDAGNAVIQHTVANSSLNGLHMAAVGHLHVAHCLANAAHLAPTPKAATALQLARRSVGAVATTTLPTDSVISLDNTSASITLDPTNIVTGQMFTITGTQTGSRSVSCTGVCGGIPTTVPQNGGFTVQMANSGTSQWSLLGQWGYASYTLPAATTSALGGVMPDGTSITVDAAGHIAAPNTGTFSSLVPAGLQFLGTGASPGPTCTSGCTLNDENWISSLNVPAGQTLSSSVARPLTIRSTGTCTIAGTISVSANTGAQGNAGLANWGGSGGGGGFGAANGTAGQHAGPTQGGGAAGTSGVSGGNGNTLAGGEFSEFVAGFTAFSAASSGTPAINVMGGSAGGAGGSAGGAGGKGGGLVVIDCLTVNFTGTIDASGVNGVAGGVNTGGGGGGGGGVVILRSPNMTNSGTISVAGGTGGVIGTGTSTKGGNGAAGSSVVFTQ